MKKANKILVAGTLTIGIGTGLFISAPHGIKAASDVVLASVDWVTSQIQPLNSKISKLETQIANQQKEIDELKTQLSQNETTPSLPGETNGKDKNEEKEIPNTVYVSKSSATIHKGATKNYVAVASRTAGSSLNVIDSFTSSSGLWYRVELSSTLKGWIHSDDVTTTKTKATPNTVITTSKVHLRKGATSAYASHEVLPKGTQLKYISSFVNVHGETWYNVEASSGKRGWVAGTYSEVK